MLLEECPVVFLDVPGVGELHLLDVRAFQACGHVLGPSHWQMLNEYHGILRTYDNARSGDLTIPGPLGWMFDNMILPAVDVIADISGIFSWNRVSVPADGTACSVVLGTKCREELSILMAETPSVCYKDGCMTLRCLSACSMESCQRLLHADLHSKMVDVPTRGMTLVVDMRNVAWCKWCTNTRLDRVLAADIKIVANDPFIIPMYAWTTTEPWTFENVGDICYPGDLHIVRRRANLSFPLDPSAWTGLFGKLS